MARMSPDTQTKTGDQPKAKDEATRAQPVKVGGEVLVRYVINGPRHVVRRAKVLAVSKDVLDVESPTGKGDPWHNVPASLHDKHAPAWMPLGTVEETPVR